MFRQATRQGTRPIVPELNFRLSPAHAPGKTSPFKSIKVTAKHKYSFADHSSIEKNKQNIARSNQVGSPLAHSGPFVRFSDCIAQQTERTRRPASRTRPLFSQEPEWDCDRKVPQRSDCKLYFTELAKSIQSRSSRESSIEKQHSKRKEERYRARENLPADQLRLVLALEEQFERMKQQKIRKVLDEKKDLSCFQQIKQSLDREMDTFVQLKAQKQAPPKRAQPPKEAETKKAVKEKQPAKEIDQQKAPKPDGPKEPEPSFGKLTKPAVSQPQKRTQQNLRAFSQFLEKRVPAVQTPGEGQQSNKREEEPEPGIACISSEEFKAHQPRLDVMTPKFDEVVGAAAVPQPISKFESGTSSRDHPRESSRYSFKQEEAPPQKYSTIKQLNLADPSSEVKITDIKQYLNDSNASLPEWQEINSPRQPAPREPGQAMVESFKQPEPNFARPGPEGEGRRREGGLSQNEEAFKDFSLFDSAGESKPLQSNPIFEGFDLS